MIKVQSGKVRVEVTGNLEAAIRRAIDRSASWIVPAVEAETEDIIADARAQWPIGSQEGRKWHRKGRPHSRDLFGSYIVVDLDGSIRGVITNEADYWLYIQGSPATEYIRKPLRKRAKRLAGELAEELRKRMAGRI